MYKKLIVAFVLPVLVLVGVLGILPQGNVAEAQIEIASPTITGSTTVHPSELVVLTATGFAEDDEVTFLFNSVRLVEADNTGAVATANESGVATVTARIPVNFVQGTYAFKAMADGGTKQDTYNATLNPDIFASVSAASEGAPITVQGFSFAASEAVTVTLTDIVSGSVLNSGTLQAGGTTTVTLAAAASAVDDYYNAGAFLTTGGTGSGQSDVVSDYDGTTKVATLTTGLATTATTTTTYQISVADWGTGCLATQATVTDSLVMTGTTNALGRVSVTGEIPDVADGTYYFVGIGETSAACAVY